MLHVKFSKEIKAGLIAIIAIVGLVILVQFMKGKNVFTSDNTFYVRYDQVDGLEPSNPVTINGLKVGLIEKIVPVTTKEGKIYFYVKFSVDNDFSFSKNSLVEIVKPDFMGSSQLKINMVYDNLLAKEGDTLKGAVKVSAMQSLTTQVKPLKNKVHSVLSNLDSTLVSTNQLLDEQNRREIKVLLTNLNNMVSSFKTTSDQAGMLIVNNEARLGRVLHSANETMVSANNTMNKYGKLAEGIDVNQLNKSFEELSQTAEKLNLLVQNIEQGKGSMGKLAKDEELYNNLTKTAGSLNALLEDFKKNPKRYVHFSVFGKKDKAPKEESSK